MIMVKSLYRCIMKEIEFKNLKIKLLPLKKTITQLLISLSIFSFLFAWFSSALSHYQNLHYFSCNPSKLRSFAANKNCIFLVFNGILFFLASLPPPPASDVDDMLQMRAQNGLQLEIAEAELSEPSDESCPSAEEDDSDDDEEEELELNGAEEVDCQEMEHCDNGALVCVGEKEDDDQYEPRDCWLFDDVDDDVGGGGEEEEEVDEIEKLSTEELNQKFEDFIRRMKEEFRVSECQQLVMVK